MRAQPSGYQIRFGLCKSICGCHLPQLIPIQLALTGVGKKTSVSVKSIGHIAVRQGSEPGKKPVGFWGTFYVGLSFFRSCFSSLPEPALHPPTHPFPL